MPGLRRGATPAALGALLAALVYAGVRLWHTTVPGGLRLPHVSAAAEIAPGTLRRAESFAAFTRWSGLLSELVLVVVLVVYARRGARFAAFSAAGPLGTGFLLGMLGIGLGWLAQLPFDVADLWWGRRHHVIHQGYLSALLGDWLGLGGRFVFACGVTRSRPAWERRVASCCGTPSRGSRGARCG